MSIYFYLLVFSFQIAIVCGITEPVLYMYKNGVDRFSVLIIISLLVFITALTQVLWEEGYERIVLAF